MNNAHAREKFQVWLRQQGQANFPQTWHELFLIWKEAVEIGAEEAAKVCEGTYELGGDCLSAAEHIRRTFGERK